MILIGDKNNSSKKILCNSTNNFTPIKIGRSNNTASNVIKILIGDSNNKAKEVYFIPLYDWRSMFFGKTAGSNLEPTFEVIAKYSDDLSNRDSKISNEFVDTLILNQTVSYKDTYIMDFSYKENKSVLEIMNRYIPYIKNVFLENVSYTSYKYLFNTLSQSLNYDSLEHIILNSNIVYLNNSFCSTPNLKSVFIDNDSIVIDNSFTSYYDGCIILVNKNKILTSAFYDKVSKLISTQSPVLLVYLCNEDTTCLMNGFVCINSEGDKTALTSDYVSWYVDKDKMDAIIG